MAKPYGITSDQHFHSWSQFASTNIHGVNTRLATILAEFERAGDEVLAAGGDTLFGAGDAFHVRGEIKPSVANPVRAALKRMRKKGLQIIFIPGNHDLEGKDVDQVGNAVEILEDCGVHVIHAPIALETHKVVLAPWFSSVTLLIEAVDKVVLKGERSEYDLIIHAPVDGVIEGLPAHGLTVEVLAELGFKRVFSGHYHNHKDLGRGVYSIGATTHQTWSDVGSKAGFLIIHDDKVEWRASRAPSFVDLKGDEDPADVPMIVDGHYIRVKLSDATEAQIANIRDALMKMGAKGVIVNATRTLSAVTRTGSSVKTGASMEVSVGEFIAGRTFGDPAAVQREALDVLSEARSVA